MQTSRVRLETSMPTNDGEQDSRMVASLPCGCELGRSEVTGTFIRLFGLREHGDRRSSFATTSTVASGGDRSVGRRRTAGFSLRFEACRAACGIEPCFVTFGNIQGAKGAKEIQCCCTQCGASDCIIVWHSDSLFFRALRG